MLTHTDHPDISLIDVTLDLDSDSSSNISDSSSAYAQYIGSFSSSRSSCPLKPGTYVPTPAFFNPITNDLDLKTISEHSIRLANSGVQGILTQGSNGEAVHLSHLERRLVTAATRAALDNAGYPDIPIIVGCGAQSVRETVELCRDAALSGGDYAMILPPSYYRSLYAAETPINFFEAVADESPIPVLIYNFPGGASGVDLDSDVILKLATHPNIVGCKLTCGNTGKLARVASAAPAGFMTMGGSADFVLQTLVVGGKGVIGGLANIAPRACVELHQLYIAGHMGVAQMMQAVVARGDWVAIKGGVVSTKSCLNAYFGYGGYGRKPLPRPVPKQDDEIKTAFEELLLLETFLESERGRKDVHFEKKKQYPQLIELECLLVMMMDDGL
jgi:4-hydroxy-2-oxoglutarate aldolase